MGAFLPPAPFFKAHRLDEITVREIDRYKAAKLKGRKLGAAQINKTLKLIAQILDVALEYELIDGRTSLEAVAAA